MAAQKKAKQAVPGLMGIFLRKIADKEKKLRAVRKYPKNVEKRKEALYKIRKKRQLRPVAGKDFETLREHFPQFSSFYRDARNVFGVSVVGAGIAGGVQVQFFRLARDGNAERVSYFAGQLQKFLGEGPVAIISAEIFKEREFGKPPPLSVRGRGFLPALLRETVLFAEARKSGKIVVVPDEALDKYYEKYGFRERIPGGNEFWADVKKVRKILEREGLFSGEAKH